MEPWQSTLSSFSNIMPYLRKMEKLSDVTFIVGDPTNQKVFHSHKFFLAIRSDVFQEMFYGTLPETQDEIEIPDVNPDIFEIMLKFIYEDTLAVQSIEEAMDTFTVAFKYNISQLMTQCRDYIKDHLTI